MTSYLKDIGPCPCVRPKANCCHEEMQAPEDILPADQKDKAPKDENNKRAANFLKEVLYTVSFVDCQFVLKVIEFKCLWDLFVLSRLRVVSVLESTRDSWNACVV